ncbi:MAG: hypothetical protein QOE45_3017 [Frankiaceae bacterium]|jgi:hypothetical protein|nr:hypothetical protein [Frankiaceae bacterium]
MGTDVQHRHDIDAPRPEPAEPEAAEAAAPLTTFAVPVAGVSRVAEAGAELLRALEPDDDRPTGPSAMVGRADDPAEAEADRVASDVVRAVRGGRGSRPVAPENDGDGVRRAAVGGADPLGGTAVGGGVMEVLQRRRGGGSGLPVDLAASMGSAFGGHDFSGVRVHADGEADTVARSLQAKAFTHGNDIYFSSGTYDPGSEGGQHLLAHELTHVVQNGGTVARKLWTAKAFETATYENWYTSKGAAQKAISKMLTEYATTFEKHGVVLTENIPKALVRIAEMKQSAQWWIKDHQVVESSDGKVTNDPDREKRMAGFVSFVEHLTKETEQLETAAKPKDGDKKKPGKEPAVEQPSPGFLKLQEKYEGDAKSFFEKMGDVAQKAVSDNGDATELEAAVKFPVDPSGIGFIGGKFKASIEMDDDMIKMKSSLSITGGANVEVAEVSGELGGYLEAQAKSGSDCMSLISYAMYRRFRESHVLPREAANYLWGGNSGSYGQKKAEQWSLGVENKMFGEEALPLLADFEKKFKTKEQATKAYEAEKKRIDKKNEQTKKTYVETGGLAGVGAKGDVGVASIEGAVQGSAGRRVDLTSLTNRKGGAGKANVASDSVFAGVAQKLSGGTRGAQKRTGRSVRSLMVMGGVSGTVGFATLKGSATLAMKWMNDGVSKKNGPSVTALDSATLELAGEAGFSLGDLAGDVAGPWVEFIQGKIEDFVAEKARPAAEAKEAETPESEDEAEFEGLDTLVEMNNIALGIDDLKDNLQEELLELAGAKSENADSYKLAVTFDMVAKSIAFELRKQGETKLAIPKGLLEVSKKSSSRMFRFTYKGGAWTRG